jgi:hypothetical protein
MVQIDGIHHADGIASARPLVEVLRAAPIPESSRALSALPPEVCLLGNFVAKVFLRPAQQSARVRLLGVLMPETGNDTQSPVVRRQSRKSLPQGRELANIETAMTTLAREPGGGLILLPDSPSP